jgi:chromosome segregation ATPase
MRHRSKFLLAGVFVISLTVVPLLAQQGGTEAGDSDSPADISHGAPKVDEALSNAIATLQGVLADLPEQANDKAREALQRNIDRLTAGHDEAMQSLHSTEAGQTPELKGVDKAIDAIQKSVDKSTTQLQKLLDGGHLPAQAVSHLQAAMDSLAKGRTTALEVLNKIKAGEQGGGRPETAAARRPDHPSKPEGAQQPDRPSRPQRPERPERGGRP